MKTPQQPSKIENTYVAFYVCYVSLWFKKGLRV